MVVTGCSSRYMPTVGSEPEWLTTASAATPRMNVCSNDGPPLWNANTRQHLHVIVEVRHVHLLELLRAYRLDADRARPADFQHAFAAVITTSASPVLAAGVIVGRARR